jgi:hypothetical protein
VGRKIVSKIKRLVRQQIKLEGLGALCYYQGLPGASPESGVFAPIEPGFFPACFPISKEFFFS